MLRTDNLRQFEWRATDREILSAGMFSRMGGRAPLFFNGAIWPGVRLALLGSEGNHAGRSTAHSTCTCSPLRFGHQKHLPLRTRSTLPWHPIRCGRSSSTSSTFQQPSRTAAPRFTSSSSLLPWPSCGSCAQQIERWTVSTPYN